MENASYQGAFKLSNFFQLSTPVFSWSCEFPSITPPRHMGGSRRVYTQHAQRGVTFISLMNVGSHWIRNWLKRYYIFDIYRCTIEHNGFAQSIEVIYEGNVY